MGWPASSLNGLAPLGGCKLQAVVDHHDDFAGGQNRYGRLEDDHWHGDGAGGGRSLRGS